MIKDFILNLQFVQEALRQAEIKAFPKAQKDVLDTMRDDLDKQANEIAETKLADMLSVVDLKKLVTLDKAKGIVFVGGNRLDETRLANLKADAEFFVNSDLWPLIYETPKELAQRAMFVLGDSLADMQKGKSMLYTLASQKNIIDVFLSYQQPKK